MDNIISEIMEQLHRNAILMKRNIHRNRFAAQAANHSGQGRILVILTENPGISQKALSELLHIRPQSLGELLLKLENAEMIEKVQNAYDKRVINIFLTDKGLKEAENIKNANKESFEALFDILSAEELQHFLDLLTKLNNSIETKMENEQPDDGASFEPNSFHHHHHDCHNHQGPPPPFFEGKGCNHEHFHHGHHDYHNPYGHHKGQGYGEQHHTPPSSKPDGDENC